MPSGSDIRAGGAFVELTLNNEEFEKNLASAKNILRNFALSAKSLAKLEGLDKTNESSKKLKKTLFGLAHEGATAGELLTMSFKDVRVAALRAKGAAKSLAVALLGAFRGAGALSIGSVTEGLRNFSVAGKFALTTVKRLALAVFSLGKALARLAIPLAGVLRKAAKATFTQIGKFLNIAGNGFKKFGVLLSQTGQKLRGLGRTLTTYGIIAAVGVGAATKRFADFDDTIRAIGAKSNATERDLTALSDKALLLGRTMSFTAQQVAAAQLELAKQGFKPDQINASVGALLDLARASGEEVPTALSTALQAIKAFQLDTSKATEVADVLTRAVNNSAATLELLGEGFSFAAPIARAAGVSFKDTAVALSILNDAGVRGSKAGTGLARILKNLSQTRFQEKLKEINIEVADLAGNLRAPVDIIQDMLTAFEGGGNVKLLGFFEEIFGRGAASALNLDNIARIDDMREKLGDLNVTARKTAKDMDAGLGGALRKMFSAVEGLALSIGEALSEPLSRIILQIRDIASASAEWVSENQGVIQSVAAGIAGVIALGGAISAAGIALSLMAPIATAIGTALIGAGVAATALALAFSSPLTVAIAGVTAVLGTMLFSFIDITGQFKTMSTTATTSFNTISKTAKESIGDILEAIEEGRLDDAFKIITLGVVAAWEGMLLTMKSIWDNFWTKLEVDFNNKVSAALINQSQGKTSLLGGLSELLGIDVNALSRESEQLNTQMETNRKTLESDLLGLQLGVQTELAKIRILAGQERTRKGDREFRESGNQEVQAAVNAMAQESRGLFDRIKKAEIAAAKAKRDEEERLRLEDEAAEIEASARPLDPSKLIKKFSTVFERTVNTVANKAALGRQLLSSASGSPEEETADNTDKMNKELKEQTRILRETLHTKLTFG